MSNEFRSNNGRGVNARKSVSLDFYEPVVVSGGAFVFLVIIDLINKNSDLIPVHSVAGVVITGLTLLLCRNNNMSAAWVMAAISSFFLLVTFWVALNQNQSVIDFKAWVGGSVRKFKKDVIWALTELDESITNTYNSVSSSLAALEAQAIGLTTGFNDALLKGKDSLTDAYNSATFSSSAWEAVYNKELRGNPTATPPILPSTPANALKFANAAKGEPPVGTRAYEIADAINKAGPIVTLGEYNYICLGKDSANPSVAPGMLELCASCGAASVTDKDSCIAKDKNPPPLACLGGLINSASPVMPDNNRRDNCVSCNTMISPSTDKKGLTNEELIDCRKITMEGRKWPTPEVLQEAAAKKESEKAAKKALENASGAAGGGGAAFTNYTGSTAGTLGGSAAAAPVAGTAAPFTNYMGGFRW